MAVYLGIDIGLSGALTAIAGNEIVGSWDMPLTGEGTNREVDARRLAELVSSPGLENEIRHGEVVHIGIERAIATLRRPGKHGEAGDEGRGSMQRYHESAGVVKGVVALSLIPYTLVAAASWKAKMLRDTNREKAASIQRAGQLFVNAGEFFTLKKHHGRAEAALIAAYVRTYILGGDA